MIRILSPLALLFLLGCGGSPGGSGAYDGGFAYFFLDIHQPFFVRGRGPGGEEVYETRNPLGREKQRFTVDKIKERFRVFVVGGSVAQLYDIGKSRPSLKDALKASLPGKTVEVINCGMSAYDIARADLIFTEILDYAPDLVIVMSGANERGHPMLTPWQAQFCRTPLIRGVCETLISRAAGYRRRDPARDRDAFARILRLMARKAAHRRVPLLFTALPASLRDMPPRGTLPLEAETFFDAWVHWERGRYKDAAAGFLRYLEADEDVRSHEGVGFAYYYLARCYDRLGDYPKARKYYGAAQNNYRPMPLMNEALRRSAAAEGVMLADLEKAFEDVSPHGLPGRNLFEDDVHWDRAADPYVTLTLMETIIPCALKEGCSPLSGTGAWDPAWLEREREGLRSAARGLKPSRERSWHVFRVRMWEPLEHQENLFSERVLSLLETVRLSIPEALEDAGAMRGWLEKKLDGNIWMKGDNAKLDRWWPAMLAHVGELHRRGGRGGEALPFFAEALTLAPGRHKARLHKALAHLALDQREAGRSEIEKIPHWRDDPVIMRWRKVYGL